MKHPSDSQAQRNAENEMRKKLCEEVGFANLEVVERFPVGDKFVQVDAVDNSERIICELYARIGKLHGSQSDKLASDILKMLWIEEVLGGVWKKHLCFASEAAAATVSKKSKSWLAQACKDFKIEIKVVKLSQNTEDILLQAQSQQKMTNSAKSSI